MKTKILFIALILSASLYTFAQSLVLIHDGVELGNNSEMVITGIPTGGLMEANLSVKNTSSSNIETKVQRYEIVLVENTSNSMCWDGLCYLPNLSLTPPHTIEGGTVYENGFQGHYEPSSQTGASIIAYTFFDVNNPNDSVLITVTYIAGTVGIDPSKEIKPEVSIYPNPVSDVLNINIKNTVNEVITYELLSITGSVVKKEVSQQNSTKLNVTDLNEGLYLYRVSTDKNILKTGRVVIKH